ncbi:cation:dicarboxylate symporter family transporter [Methylobacterium oryzae CBMB20]
MAFTIGEYGIQKVYDLAWLVGTFYHHGDPVRAGGAGTIARVAGFSILRFLAYIKDELLIVVGTSSSETVLPQLDDQDASRLGASDSVVGLVVPTGYSFNLDGTNIYYDAGHAVPGAGRGRGPVDQPVRDHHPGRDADLEGRLGRHRSGLHHPGGDALGDPQQPVPVAAMTLVLGIDKFMSGAARSPTSWATASPAWWSAAGKASSTWPSSTR